MAPTPDLQSKFSALSDERWRALMMRSLTEHHIDGAEFPGFPEESVQVMFTSWKREEALEESYRFFKIAKAACAKHGHPLSKSTRMLDFGVGWGRICRMFMKDVPADNIVGVDVNEDILSTCRSIVPYGTFMQCANGQPLSLPAGGLDLAVAFSVFSHLPEKNHWHWLRELHRVLKPGGTAVFTTLAPNFLSMCTAAAGDPESNDWNRNLAKLVTGSYPNWKKELTKFDPKAFFYLPSGGGLKNLEPENYGWAMIQRGYAEKNWRELFEVSDYLDDASNIKQAVFVLRKR
ncbi:MAG: class I SAM-dependent methyltransferase [Myxococcaceae bacterium]